MNFDVVNYSFLLQDFVYAMAAGFSARLFNAVLSLFLYGGRLQLWIRDMLVAFVFSVLVFSYVVSFANYPDIRIYHILGALLGFLSFDFKFSTFFCKILEKFTNKIKHHILCCGKKLYSTGCVMKQKLKQNTKKEQPLPKNTDLKNNNNWVYNL